MYTEQMYENSLCHYGVKGQKWGDRRFQNLDGTYTALGERRRLETLARTGTSVKPTSALANRQAQARTGNVVRVNSVNRNTTSRPLSRPVTTSTGASKVVLDKATGTVKRVPASVVTRPTAKIVTSEEAQKAKKKLAKASTETTDEEETKTTKKKTSAKKKSTKKTKAQKEAEQKAKEAQEQAAKEQEEKKDETQNEGPLSEEQVQDYARRVIRGEFGNGQERKDKLGDKYAQVQALVNALLLKGRKK